MKTRNPERKMLMNKQIRKVSNTTALPVLIFALGSLVFSALGEVLFEVIERAGVPLYSEMKTLILYSLVLVGRLLLL